MGAAIDTVALAECIRAALAGHLADHVDGDETVVTVTGDGRHAIYVEVDGFEFTLTLGDAQANPLLAEPADAG